VVLPPRGEARVRWLRRGEAARLLLAAHRYREVQKGFATGRRALAHIARFILVGLYTGTRAGAIGGPASSSSLLIRRQNIPAVRPTFHLTPCSKFRDHLRL